jgi:hypothetical protein
MQDNPFGMKQADVRKTINGLIPCSSFGVRMIEHYLPIFLEVCEVYRVSACDAAQFFQEFSDVSAKFDDCGNVNTEGLHEIHFATR